MTVCVAAKDLDPVRLDIEADLPGGDLHRRPHRYPVMPVDALSDREFDWVHARRVDAHSTEVRVLHAIILSHGWRAPFAGPVPVADRLQGSRHDRHRTGPLLAAAQPEAEEQVPGQDA